MLWNGRCFWVFFPDDNFSRKNSNKWHAHQWYHLQYGHRWIPLTKASGAQLWCFFFIYAWINGGVNSHEAGDLRRHRAHYDVIAMVVFCGSYLMIQFTHIRQGCFTAWLQDRHWDNHFKSNSKVTSAWWFYAYLRGSFTCIWTIYRLPQCWKSNTEGRTARIERLR